MKKKIPILLLLAVLAFNLVSCGKDDDDKPTDPRDKFVGTYAGTLTCNPGGNQAGNVQIVKAAGQNEIDVVGFGIGTINGNSFTVPTQSATTNGITTTTNVSGSLNAAGNALSFNRTTTVSAAQLPFPVATNCTGNLGRQ